MQTFALIVSLTPYEQQAAREKLLAKRPKASEHQLAAAEGLRDISEARNQFAFGDQCAFAGHSLG